VLISVFFNHAGRDARSLCGRTTAGLTFSEVDFLLTMSGCAQNSASRGSDPKGISGSNVMTFVGRLSVITAYLAMAFVGAIVLGMI
jgi:hypothetical protein